MTDLQLLARLADLSKTQAKVESEIIQDLVEVERRRLHLKKAYRSLFEFVFVHLKCSEATAARRVAIVKAATKFPVVLDALRCQSVTLTNLAMIAPHLTAENHLDLLARIAGLSKRDVEKIVASLTPSKPKRDVVKPVMVMVSVPEGPLTSEGSFRDKGFEGEALVLESVQPEVKVRCEEKVRFAFDAPAALAEKIQRLKEIHALKLKDGSLAEVIELAVEMMLDRTAPERKPEPKKKAEKTADSGVKAETRRPPRAAQRQVFQRDQGQCTFMDPNGKRCASKTHIQIDHIHPWAKGGSSKSVGNLRLLCRAHNLLMAQQHFPHAYSGCVRAWRASREAPSQAAFTRRRSPLRCGSQRRPRL